MSELVGILNVTPDSFSDGGQYLIPELAIAAADRLVHDGANVIDVGAESTRPGAVAISASEEWERLAPVLKSLRDFSIPISVDTRHAQTAQKSLEMGVSWINDVSGFRDFEMVRAVRHATCKLVVMHSLTVPANREIVLAADVNPIEFLIKWVFENVARLELAGIGRDRIIFDPGLGFGKTSEQSLYILENIHRFQVLNIPLLVGHSRKSFLGNIDRDTATLTWSKKLVALGVDYLRVHDIGAHKGLLHGSY